MLSLASEVSVPARRTVHRHLGLSMTQAKRIAWAMGATKSTAWCCGDGAGSKRCRLRRVTTTSIDHYTQLQFHHSLLSIEKIQQ